MSAGWRGTLRPLATVTTALAATLALVTLPAQHAQAATTTITVNGTGTGRVFNGIGAISGGGGNTRLLTDYPAAQQSQILDYLFKPGYGAALQILKVEIGGDTNSTDGSESSHMHTSGTTDCNTGYEWWLMQQAQARNPNIKFYGLAWGAPGWIGGGTFFSTDMINYIVSWLNCAKSKGLTISYLGGWNERGYNISWYEQLRSTLNADGYSAVQIVGADTDWTIANDLVSNSAFSSAVQIVGAHYPCGYLSSESTCNSTANAVATGKPLWASENGSQDFNAGAAAMARADNRDYIDGKMTAHDQLADRRRDLPGPAVQHRRPDRGQPAVVRKLLGRQAGLGDRADHPVHRARLDLHRLGHRLPAGQPGRRQLRHAEVDQRHRLVLDHRDHGRHGRPDRDLQRHRRPVDRRRARLDHERQLGQPVDLVRPLDRHHADQRQLLADPPARHGLLADHDDRPGQGHRRQPGPGHPDAALLRQLRHRHHRPAAEAAVPDAGRVRGRDLRRRPHRPLPAAAGRDEADRVGQQRQPVHDRRQPVLGQLHGLRRRADPAGRRRPAARPGRHADGLLPGRHQRLLLPGRQHRSLVDLPQQHQRHDHHARQRHGHGARHRHLAPPVA